MCLIKCNKGTNYKTSTNLGLNKKSKRQFQGFKDLDPCGEPHHIMTTRRKTKTYFDFQQQRFVLEI